MENQLRASEETHQERATESSIFREFLGKQIKAPYRDGDQHNIARGKLEDVRQGFLKIHGKRGTIIINERNIERMAPLEESSRSS